MSPSNHRSDTGGGDSAGAIVVDNVSKVYGKTTALDRMSLRFEAGALTGFLGPNGAGKTTTFRSILGLTRPQVGAITVLGMTVGRDTPAIVKRVGAVIEEPGLIGTLDGADNMAVAALTLGADRAEIPGLLDFVDLTDAADRTVTGYSKGMRQRLALAIAMLGDPDILILDEPLDGLDPAGQRALKERLRALVDEHHKTVIVSSHDLADVQELADQVVVIAGGRHVASGSMAEVLGSEEGLRLEVPDVGRAVEILQAAGFDPAEDTGGVVVSSQDGAAVNGALVEAGIYLSLLEPRRASLEKVFLDLTRGGGE